MLFLHVLLPAVLTKEFLADRQFVPQLENGYLISLMIPNEMSEQVEEMGCTGSSTSVKVSSFGGAEEEDEGGGNLSTVLGSRGRLIGADRYGRTSMLINEWTWPVQSNLNAWTRADEPLSELMFDWPVINGESYN